MEEKRKRPERKSKKQRKKIANMKEKGKEKEPVYDRKKEKK